VTAALECADLASRFGMRGFRWAVLGNGAQALTWLGRWDEAERMAEAAADIDPDVAGSGSVVLTARALIRLWRGDLATARTDIVAALHSRQNAPDPQVVSPALSLLAGVATWEGRPKGGRPQ
jgi:hypothetical protein